MLTTKNIPQTSKISKTLLPGNVKARVRDIELTKGYNDNSYNLVFHLESEAIGEGFEGFFIDKDDESKGRYNGQVGKIRASQYAFEDKTLPNGDEINRDENILKTLLNLAKALGKSPELNAIEAATIEEYIEKAKPVLCIDTELYFCLAGRTYQNKAGYNNFDLYLPKPKKGENKYAFSTDKANVIRFDADTHIIGKKVETSTDFEPTATEDDLPF